MVSRPDRIMTGHLEAHFRQHTVTHEKLSPAPQPPPSKFPTWLDLCARWLGRLLALAGIVLLLLAVISGIVKCWRFLFG